MSDLGSNNLNRHAPVTPIIPVTGWSRVCGSSDAVSDDGNGVVTNPRSTSSHSTNGYLGILKEVGRVSGGVGRLLLNRSAQQRVELWPLITEANSMQLQVWGYDFLDADGLGITDSGVVFPQQAAATADGRRGIALGLPYPLTLDTHPTEDSIVVAANINFQLSLKFSGAQPYEAASGGTTYFPCPRLRFDCGGVAAVLPLVNALSLSNTGWVILGRFI